MYIHLTEHLYNFFPKKICDRSINTYWTFVFIFMYLLIFHMVYYLVLTITSTVHLNNYYNQRRVNKPATS